MNPHLDTSCVFCRIIAKEEPADIIFEDALVIAFLDKHPQTRGHFQVVPKLHCRWIWQHPAMGQIFTIIQRRIRDIIPLLGADHVTIHTFGREITHAHVWVVPQYKTERKVSELSKKLKTATDPKALSALIRDALR
jgi:histidine triad (HIT) family protein